MSGAAVVAGPAAPAQRVRSLERGLALLVAVGDAGRDGRGTAELADACGLNRATAWRLLATLEDRGFIERDPASNRYRMGYAVLRLSAAAGVEGLVRRAHHVLVRISEQTGETADLALAGRQGLTYVDEVAPPSVLAANWLGRPVPLHATSSGKAFLAWLPPAEAAALLAAPLTPFTDATLVSPERMQAELAATRQRGYGICRGELEPTLYGVSAPVLDAAGRPVAVFSIWGPRDRVPDARFAALGQLARDAAASVAHALELSPGAPQTPRA
jgi:DNA-binding IclR family transcriptional regulator